MYQIGNCACAKTAHILKVSEVIVFCLFVAVHWKTILFIEANAITGHSICFGQRIFRVPTRQCPAHRAKETVALLTTETPDFVCDCMLVFALPVKIMSIVCSDIIHSLVLM